MQAYMYEVWRVAIKFHLTYNKIEMKQTLEGAAMQELNSSYAIIVDGELAYQRQAMLNMFFKGAEWQAKQILEANKVKPKTMCLRDKSKVCNLCHECDVSVLNPSY